MLNNVKQKIRNAKPFTFNQQKSILNMSQKLPKTFQTELT